MRRLAIISALILLGGMIQCEAVAAAAKTATIDTFSGKPCADCHRSKVTALFVHDALAGDICTPCHKISNGNHQRNHWLAEAKDRSARLCYECHEDRSGLKSVHQPIRDNDCLCCHTQHAANNENLLKFENKALCFECHDPALVKAKKTRSATGFRDGEENLHYRHAGENDIPCLTCHEPHAGSQDHLIRQKGAGSNKVTVTFTVTATGGNCTTSCHDQAGYKR